MTRRFSMAGLFLDALILNHGPAAASEASKPGSAPGYDDADITGVIPLWFDGRSQEYHGCLVHLEPGTTSAQPLLR